MSKRSLLAPLLGLALAACSQRGDTPLAPTPPPNAPIFGSTVIEGVTVTLETYLARDFMPFSPPDGRPLAAVFTIRSEGGLPLPMGLEVRTATVINQGERWVSDPVEQPVYDPSVLNAVARDGPKWGPGISVDVLVTLALRGRDRVVLGAADQPIRRTD